MFGAPIVTYLQDAKVRQQLHIDPAAAAWDLCNSDKSFVYKSGRTGSIDIYPKLKNKYRMLKYSGDTDGSVPTYGTLQWIKELKWDVTEAWRPYYVIDDNGQ